MLLEPPPLILRWCVSDSIVLYTPPPPLEWGVFWYPPPLALACDLRWHTWSSLYFPSLDLRGSTMSAWTAGNVSRCIVKYINRMRFVADQRTFHRHMIDKSSRWSLGWCWLITLVNMGNFMEIYWWCTQALSISFRITCLNCSFMHHITSKCVLISAQLE